MAVWGWGWGVGVRAVVGGMQSVCQCQYQSTARPARPAGVCMCTTPSDRVGERLRLRLIASRLGKSINLKAIAVNVQRLFGSCQKFAHADTHRQAGWRDGTPRSLSPESLSLGLLVRPQQIRRCLLLWGQSLGARYCGP